MFSRRKSDVEKWKKDWWKNLNDNEKVIYLLLWDNASDAGIIDQCVDKNMEVFYRKISDNKYYILGFIPCHYKFLCRSFKRHMVIINELEKHGLLELPEIKSIIIDEWGKTKKVERGGDEFLRNMQTAGIKIVKKSWKIFKELYPETDYKNISEWAILECKDLSIEETWRYMCRLAERKMSEK